MIITSNKHLSTMPHGANLPHTNIQRFYISNARDEKLFK